MKKNGKINPLMSHNKNISKLMAQSASVQNWLQFDLEG
jgi:hypothetical protein